jgi:Zn-finger nucleic acid-binding protein
MNCPACKEPMFVAEYDQVEVDCCAQCQGVWLDAGELELLFGDAGQGAAFLSRGSPHGVASEKRRRCPICRRKMEKAVTQGEHPVQYDRCARGHGIWLDKGELEQILAHGVPHEGGGLVTAHLREVFGGAQPNPVETR